MSVLFNAWRELGPMVISRHDFQKTGLTFSAVFGPSMVSEAARKAYEAGWFLEDIVAMQVKEGFLVTYHYASFTEPGRAVVRALADDRGEIWSINSVFQGAEWHEREQTDFFGLKFFGNPNPVPLLLPHDFPLAPPLLKEEKALAHMRDLGLFGEAEVLDPAWEDIVNPPQTEKEEGVA